MVSGAYDNQATPAEQAPHQTNRGTAISTLDNWGNVTAYTALVIGLLFAILSASHLTLIGFVALVAAHILWLAVFSGLTRSDLSDRGAYLLALLLAISALLGLSTSGLGMGYDWLLPITTISVIALALPLRDAVITAIAMYGLAAAILYWITGDPAPKIFTDNLTLAPAYVFCLVFSIVLRQQQEQRERAESLVAQLEAAQTQLRAYAAEVEDLSATRERNRMAREIHDTLGHYLTILSAQLETAIKLEQREHQAGVDGDQLREQLAEARRVATECLAEVRRSVAALRPAGAISGTFEEALRRLVAEAQMSDLQTTITLDVEGDTAAITPEARVALYRCAQEALTNIRKHAHASRALVRLRVEPVSDSAGERQVELTILDDGMGRASEERQKEEQQNTDAEAKPAAGFGIQGMRERIALLGGAVSTCPLAERGWRVEVRLPLATKNVVLSEVGA